MQTEIFDLNKVKTLSPVEAKLYVDKYFVPLTDGNHALLSRNGSYEIFDDAIVKRTYFKRMSTELNKYYFTDKTDLKTITYNINKPIIYDNFLNLCPQIKQTYKPTKEFSKETQDKCNHILKYTEDVLCSNKNDSFKFLIKWLANLVRGNRNESALYFKSPQGCGKSTLLEFIRAYVIGNDLCSQGGSGPLKSRFNSELSGKLMVVFEELENFSSSEWIAISSVLKRQITSPTLQIERKGKDVREETNLNNYILISNNDAIQDDDGRRYFILDVSTKYIENTEYFNKLYSCFNNEVGQMFYSYLMEVDLTDYNAQSYPMTKSKLDSFSKRLDNVFKFLKDEFVLAKIGIERITIKNLYDKYISYSNLKQLKIKGKIEFNTTLSDIGIQWKKSNGEKVYKVSADELAKIANKFHWINEIDEYYKNEENVDDEEYENGINQNDPSVNTNELFNKQIGDLEDENETLKDVIDDMIEYTKQLEQYIEKLEPNEEEEDDEEIEETVNPMNDIKDQIFTLTCKFNFNHREKDRQMLDEHYETVVKSCNRIIRNELKINNDDIKANVYIPPSPEKDGNIYKDHFSIKYCDIKMTKLEKEMIYKELRKYIIDDDVFSSIPFINDYSDILDTSMFIEDDEHVLYHSYKGDMTCTDELRKRNEEIDAVENFVDGLSIFE